MESGDLFYHPESLHLDGDLVSALAKKNVRLQECNFRGEKVTIFFSEHCAHGLSKQALLKMLNTEVSLATAEKKALNNFEKSLKSSRRSISADHIIHVGHSAAGSRESSYPSPAKNIQEGRNSINKTSLDLTQKTSKDSTKNQIDRLKDKLYNTSSFQKTYKEIEDKGLKDKLKTEFQSGNNLLTKLLQKIANALGINTDIGYLNNPLQIALKKQSTYNTDFIISDVVFIISEGLYATVDDDIIKAVLSLPDHYKKQVLEELFKSCIDRNVDQNKDQSIADQFIKRLLNSPEGIDAASNLAFHFNVPVDEVRSISSERRAQSTPLAQMIRYSTALAPFLPKLKKALSSNVVKDRIKLQQKVLTDPSESNIEALKDLNSYYLYDQLGNPLPCKPADGQYQKMQKIDKEDFLHQVFKQIEAKRDANEIGFLDYERRLYTLKAIGYQILNRR